MVKKGVVKKKKDKENKIMKRKKTELWWAFTKIMPKVYQEMKYTPQELWKKFTEYVERSDKNGEEITISGFWCYASLWINYLSQNKSSQSFSWIVESIYQFFENRYEQKASKWESVSYVMNVRFRDRWWKSVTQVDNTHTINTDVKGVLDKLTWDGEEKPAE